MSRTCYYQLVKVDRSSLSTLLSYLFRTMPQGSFRELPLIGKEEDKEQWNPYYGRHATDLT